MTLSVKIFWKVFSGLLFVVVSGTVLFFAYGYRYDFEQQEIQKTSIIDFQGKFAEVNVNVDGSDVVNRMPYQYKGVLPGIHELVVDKKGFHSWYRNVKVIEDRVTIVDDVLLVPENLSDYENDLYNIDLDKEWYVGDKYLLEVSPGENILQVLVFGEEGKVSMEDIQLFKPIKQVVDIMADQKFLLQLEGDSYVYVDLAAQRFNVFYLPEKSYAVKIDKYEGRVLFLIDSDLYRVNFEKLTLSSEVELEDYLVANEVSDYGVDYYGGFYYVSGGDLYYSDGDKVGEPVVFEGADDFEQVKNIAIREAGDKRSLIIRTVSDKRFLFIVGRNGELLQLCDSLDGIPFYADSGLLAYELADDHAVFLYDMEEEEKLFIFQDLVSDFSIEGWYANWKYLLLKNEQNDIYVLDLFDNNKMILLEDFAGEFVRSNGYSLYLFDSGVLRVQYFEEAMRSKANVA